MNSEGYFEKVADQWDRMRKSFFSDRVREVAVSKAGVVAGKLAADIGAGTGFMTEELIKNRVKVIAVDQSEAMLGEMKKKFSLSDSVEYRRGDFDSLPIRDESVDYSFANMFLHHVDSPPVAIKEMARVLRPGGNIVVTDLDEHEFEFLKKEQHDRWMGFKREDIKRWFEDAGLQNVEVNCVGEDCCSDSELGCDQAKISVFLAASEKP
jgi:ubiquinone/menaquinone biosynthesis C-methylase UbiE